MAKTFGYWNKLEKSKRRAKGLMWVMLSDMCFSPNSGLNIKGWANLRNSWIGLGKSKNITCWYLVSLGYCKPLTVSAVNILGAPLSLPQIPFTTQPIPQTLGGLLQSVFTGPSEGCLNGEPEVPESLQSLQDSYKPIMTTNGEVQKSSSPVSKWNKLQGKMHMPHGIRLSLELHPKLHPVLSASPSTF